MLVPQKFAFAPWSDPIIGFMPPEKDYYLYQAKPIKSFSATNLNGLIGILSIKSNDIRAARISGARIFR